MKFIVYLILYFLCIVVTEKIALFLDFNIYILMPWCLFALMTVQILRGEFEKVENKKIEIAKLFMWNAVITLFIYMVDKKW